MLEQKVTKKEKKKLKKGRNREQNAAIEMRYHGNCGHFLAKTEEIVFLCKMGIRESVGRGSICCMSSILAIVEEAKCERGGYSSCQWVVSEFAETKLYVLDNIVFGLCVFIFFFSSLLYIMTNRIYMNKI